MNAFQHICIWCAITLQLLFVASASETPKFVHTNVCFNRVNGRERDVTNCNQYFTCSNGIATVVKCRMQLLYSHKLQECQLTSDSLREQCFSCSNATAFSDSPVDFQCNQYVRCFLGMAEQRVCNLGTLFDPATGTCNLAERVQCGCPQVNRRDPWFIRNRDDCSRYGVCLSGKLIQMECPPDLYFNEDSHQCEILADGHSCHPGKIVPIVPPTEPPTTQAPTTSTMTTTTAATNSTTQRQPTICDPSRNDVYYAPHPGDCTLFFVCAFGTPSQRSCPHPSRFDVPTRACTHPGLAHCFE